MDSSRPAAAATNQPARNSRKLGPSPRHDRRPSRRNAPSTSITRSPPFGSWRAIPLDVGCDPTAGAAGRTFLAPDGPELQAWHTARLPRATPAMPTWCCGQRPRNNLIAASLGVAPRLCLLMLRARDHARRRTPGACSAATSRKRPGGGCSRCSTITGAATRSRSPAQHRDLSTSYLVALGPRLARAVEVRRSARIAARHDGDHSRPTA